MVRDFHFKVIACSSPPCVGDAVYRRLQWKNREGDGIAGTVIPGEDQLWDLHIPFFCSRSYVLAVHSDKIRAIAPTDVDTQSEHADHGLQFILVLV